MSAARKVEYGGRLHRIANKPPKGTGARILLASNHPAHSEGRTLFRSRVTHPSDSPRLLVGGFNARKIGGRIEKGKWRGLPVYTLTLEERATCPRSCTEWAGCYGNSMNWARRLVGGLALEAGLIDELVDLSAKHRQGFAVRLHVLGDFYSPAYAALWADALVEIPGLHLFGFSARPVDGEIGSIIASMNRDHPDRCRIRFSASPQLGKFGAAVIDRFEDSQHVVCPVQTGKTDCCGTCGLCWTSNRTIEFVRH